ncbi:MAG: hypothetical protein WC893_00740 [Candidatus Paceibacterota bacterium]|jgi:hypothetical protein
MPERRKTTQDFVPIKEIRNGVLILKDNSMRSVLMVSSLNFGLKSEDEKKAILFGYQNFLNSLDFLVQIYIQSRRLDIQPYISILEQRMIEQTNELLKIQIKEYMEFIRVFTERNNVMTKSFFIVIPYTPPIIKKGGEGIISKITSMVNKKPQKTTLNNDFDENVEQLNQRINVVKGGLSRVGLRADILGTEEMIELYFKMYNPGENQTPNLTT